jgi:hypothetical protein
MHTCVFILLANTVDFTNICTILYISRSATTVTAALSHKVYWCTLNLVSVFPVQFHLPGLVEKSHNARLHFLSSCHNFWKYFSVHIEDNFYILAVCFWTLHFTSWSCKLFCSNILYRVFFFCGTFLESMQIKNFVNVNQFHSKTNCTACLVQCYKIPISCFMLQQWLRVIARVCMPTVCFSPKQQYMLDLSHRAATRILLECSNCLEYNW